MMVGENIKRIRARLQITQKDLADNLGVSRQAVCMWETGKRDLRATMLQKISKTFGVSVDEIVYGERNNKDRERVSVRR